MEIPARLDDEVRVLAVDDDEKNLLAISALLAELPAQVVLARSGEEALRRLLMDDYAVVLLDVRMPGLDGFEVATLIRERERTRRTPIIFLTAHARADADLLRGYQLGAVDFLTKPVLPEEILREKVGWFVTARRAALELGRERARAQAAELQVHQRAIVDARRDGEEAALRSEMERHRLLVDRLNRATERLAVLSSIAGDLVLATDPLEVLPRHLEGLSSHLGLEVSLLHLAGDEGLTLRYHAGIGAEPLAALASLDAREVLFGQAAAGRRPITLEGAAVGGDPALRLLGVWAAASHPLVAEDRLIGVLTFGTRHRAHLDQDELGVLDVCADQAAMALDRARLIDELRRRARELAEVDQRKDEFLAMLAHELRNPLAPILSGLELLGRGGAGEAVRARALEAAGRQARHLARLVDDLVDVSRIRTGKVELRRQRVELTAVVQDAVTAVEPLLRRQHQELHLSLPDDPVVLDGDPVRLTQALENLLHNAAKYTDPGGHVGLLVRRDEGGVVIRVEDDGIGIAPELLPRVFEIFVQGKQPPHRARGGLGLGLALVRSLVELHGGSVAAQSAGLGKGSAFELRLPAPAPAAERAPAAAPAPSAAAEDAPAAPEDLAPAVPDGEGRPAVAEPLRLRIAVIEDNADIRETLRALLELCGHEVVEADDGPRGVELVLSRRPDVALVDIGLPGLDGFEVAARVRARPGGATRLVALTGYGAPEDRSRAARAGFDAHLVKPVEMDALTRTLESLAVPRGPLAVPAPVPAPEPGAAPCPTSP